MKKKITKRLLIQNSDSIKYICLSSILLLVFITSFFVFVNSMQSIKDLSQPISLKSIITIALCVTSVVLLPLTDTIKAIKIQRFICSGKYTYEYCKIERFDIDKETQKYALVLNNGHSVDITENEFKYYKDNENESEFIGFSILNRYLIFDCKDYCIEKGENTTIEH